MKNTVWTPATEAVHLGVFLIPIGRMRGKLPGADVELTALPGADIELTALPGADLALPFFVAIAVQSLSPSTSMRPHGRHHARLPCPSLFPELHQLLELTAYCILNVQAHLSTVCVSKTMMSSSPMGKAGFSLYPPPEL